MNRFLMLISTTAIVVVLWAGIGYILDWWPKEIALDIAFISLGITGTASAIGVFTT